MKLYFLLIAVVLLPVALPVAGSGQKKPDRPKVHADFYWGSIPPSRDAAATMANEKVRLVMVAYHVGWNDDKIAKELKISTREIGEAYGMLMDRGLVAHRQAEVVPAVPVIRDRDVERLSDALDLHSRGLADLLGKESGRVDTFLASLSGPKESPRERRLYAALVSGVLLGGMIEVFAEDKTFLPPPPRRSGGQYYGWLAEGEPALAGMPIREAWESEGYQIVSLGNALADPRPQLDTVRRDGFVLEDAEARRFRLFALTFSRDTLLPFFKSRRDEFLKAHQRVEAGKYASFASFFGWYYTMLAQRSVDRLVADKALVRPASSVVYALKTAVR